MTTLTSLRPAVDSAEALKHARAHKEHNRRVRYFFMASCFLPYVARIEAGLQVNRALTGEWAGRANVEGFSLKKDFLKMGARLPAQDYLEPEAAREKRKTAHAMKRLRIPMTTNCQEGG